MVGSSLKTIIEAGAFMMSQFEFVIAWLNRSFKGIFGRVFGLNPEFVEQTNADVNGGSEPKEEKFLENIKNSFQREGSVNKRFFKDNPKFFENLASKAMSFAKNMETSMDSEDLAKMVQVSLHQQVIYCDDSKSMKRGGRWGSQTILINRIARITTRILPEGEGTHLRYINQNIDNADSLSLEALPGIVENIQPIGRQTPLGTNLKSKILEPLIYSKLPDNLKRPFLISVITDGMPSGEKMSTFVDNITECGQKLEESGLPRAAVKFLVGQIGSDQEAENFLKEISQNEAIRDVVFVVSEKLDKPENLGDELNMERWLMETLYAPIIQAENFRVEEDEEEG